MKHELDRRVAEELGVPARNVSRVTTEFFRQVTLMLLEAGYAIIDGFGTFKVFTMKPQPVKLRTGFFGTKPSGKPRWTTGRQVRVHFSKSGKLKKELTAFKE